MPTTFWGGGKFWQLTPPDCWSQLPKLPQKKVQLAYNERTLVNFY